MQLVWLLYLFPQNVPKFIFIFFNLMPTSVLKGYHFSSLVKWNHLFNYIFSEHAHILKKVQHMHPHLTELLLKQTDSNPVNTFSTTKLKLKGCHRVLKCIWCSWNSSNLKKLQKHNKLWKQNACSEFHMPKAQDSYNSRAIINQATMIFFQWHKSTESFRK